MPEIYGHSLAGRPVAEWETLADHLCAVAARAADHAAPFGWSQAARVAGQLHDIGKCSSQFQGYIRSEGRTEARGGDHSTAGAVAAARLCGHVGQLLAHGIAGHHAGLADAPVLRRRIESGTEPAGWQDQAGAMPEPAQLRPDFVPAPGGRRGFLQAFLIRMLFSCLVDADYLETERFYRRAEKAGPARGGYRSLDELAERLRASLARMTDAAVPSALNRLRAEVLAHATAKAAELPGLFTLTVPTGGGKTLTSLSFALAHAHAHGLRRVVYVIPFTSIIEQTAEVFRRALDSEEDVLEHHATFDWERGAHPDDAGQDGRERLRLATENWDAPVIVTTAVQFFESLFAARPSRCRKLHNLARSVIVLDEAQTLPLKLLHPCLAALDELRLNYGTSVMLCTATQPAIRQQDGFNANGRTFGLDIPDTRELAPDPPALYARLSRVRVEQAGEVGDDALAARFAACPQMLCIVNHRLHAAELFERIRKLDGAAHLTTLMVPRHRRRVLAALRGRLREGLPVRLVATSLIEAGVDISFPEVWRAVAGVDSIAQAAGRCNREGGPVPGRVVVFKAAGRAPLQALVQAAEAAEVVLGRHADPLTLEAVGDYFAELYWTKGAAAFDAAKLGGEPFPIMERIAAGAPRLAFPFDNMAQAFRLIDETMEPVIVPWRADPDDDHARTLLSRISAMDRPAGSDLRALQQYTVTVPARAQAEWLARGVLQPVHRALGTAMLKFGDDALYDQESGLRLFEPTYRSLESNIS